MNEDEALAAREIANLISAEINEIKWRLTVVEHRLDLICQEEVAAVSDDAECSAPEG